MAVSSERRKEILEELDALLDVREPLAKNLRIKREYLAKLKTQLTSVKDMLIAQEELDIMNQGDEKIAEIEQEIQYYLNKGVLSHIEQVELKGKQETLNYILEDKRFFNSARDTFENQVTDLKREIYAHRRDYAHQLQDFVDMLPDQYRIADRLFEELGDDEIKSEFLKQSAAMISFVENENN